MSDDILKIKLRLNYKYILDKIRKQFGHELIGFKESRSLYWKLNVDHKEMWTLAASENWLLGYEYGHTIELVFFIKSSYTNTKDLTYFILKCS